MHEIEYNKFELIFIYHSLYNLQDVSRKQKADETDGRGEKTGTEEAILCIYYMTRMEIPFRTALTTSIIITMTIRSEEHTSELQSH